MLAHFATPANGSFHHYKPRSTPGAHAPSRTPRIDRLALTCPRIYQVHDLAHSAKRVVKRAAIEAKNSLKYSADESPFLSFEQQQAVDKAISFIEPMRHQNDDATTEPELAQTPAQRGAGARVEAGKRFV